MVLWKKLTGIIGGEVQLDFTGPRISYTSTDQINIKDKDSNDGKLNIAKVTGLSMPTGSTDATSKSYVDAVGIPKASCRLTTTTNHGLSGLADIDGETPIADDRILVQGQDNPEDNGIYDAASGAWSRSDDADGTPEGEVSCGMHTFIREGTLHGGCSFILITENPITVGTTELEFTHFFDATGAVPKTLFDANTILVANSDDTPIALTIAASRFLGRKSTGSITDMTKAEALTELNVEDGADVTDTANVTTALNSINVNEHADITSAGADIEDAVTKKHSANTDTQLDSGELTVDADDCVKINETAYFDAEFDNGNSGAADTIDWKVGNKQKSTLTANCTYTFTAPSGPCNLIFKIIQDSTPRTIIWPATVKWPGGTAPIISTGSGDIDLIAFYYDGTNYFGMASLDFSVPV